MKFFRLPFLDEKRLAIEVAAETEFVMTALETKHECSLRNEYFHNATFTNLYHYTRRYEYVYFSDLIAQCAKKNRAMTLLDIGCGITYAPFEYSKMTQTYDAIDLLDYREFWENVCDRVSFHQHDITTASFGEGKYDLVISISVLEHIPAQQRLTALRNAVESLKVGGVLALTFDVDLEGGGAGFSFDELTEAIMMLQKLGLSPLSEIDLTTYDDILTSEPFIGLPKNRFRLPWRRRDEPTIFGKLFEKAFGIKNHVRGNSIAVVYGEFAKQL